MDGANILILVVALCLFAGLGVLFFIFKGSASKSSSAAFRGLMPDVSTQLSGRGSMRKMPTAHEEFDVEEIKLRTHATQAKSRAEDIESKLFRAGVYTASDRARFSRLRLILPFVLGATFLAFAFLVIKNPKFVMLFGVVGFFAGFAGPMSWLEKRIRAREEETMYFLPLVIEQIAIGVSSSLDIGPCIAHIVEMADQRDSHNPVTEMFVHTEKLMKSGMNLEDSLIEVSAVNGQTEVKHAFMFLAQCAKHGGEISKQLQELADAVMIQRQVYVEARIAALPVKATGPLALVFGGFFGLLFAGLMVRLFDAFGGGG